MLPAHLSSLRSSLEVHISHHQMATFIPGAWVRILIGFFWGGGIGVRMKLRPGECIGKGDRFRGVEQAVEFHSTSHCSLLPSVLDLTEIRQRVNNFRGNRV